MKNSRMQPRRCLPSSVVGGIVGALLVLAAQALPVGRAEAKSKTIEASAFVLRDAGNNMRVKLSLYKGNPRLVFADAQGRPRLLLALEGDQPQLGLSDENGTVRALLLIDTYGPGLVFRDANAHVRVSLANVGEGPHTGPRLTFWDPRNKTRLLLNAQIGDPTIIHAQSPNGPGAAWLQVGPKGGALVLRDPKGVEVHRKP